MKDFWSFYTFYHFVFTAAISSLFKVLSLNSKDNHLNDSNYNISVLRCYYLSLCPFVEVFIFIHVFTL